MTASKEAAIKEIDEARWILGGYRELNLLINHPHHSIKVHAWLELRPAYCDRGHIKLNIDGIGDLDEQDGFPRYFFSFAEADAHVRTFLKWRLWEHRTHPHTLEVPS